MQPDRLRRLLENELRGSIRGEVRFDDSTRALYSTDGSNYRQVPIGVVLPRDAGDVVTAMRICRQAEVPVLARGGGTSLCGQTCNVAVVLDMSKYMNRIVELDPERKFARVEPGVILDTLRDAAEKHHLTFAPDPSTHNRCTLGGMIGNNSCGVHSVMGGKTSENVEELEILTYDGHRMKVGPVNEEELKAIIDRGGRQGEIYGGLRDLRDRYAKRIRERFPRIPRRVSGYGLEELLPENGFNVARALVGTEGTCVTVLEAKLRLIHSPPARTLLVLGFEDIFKAADTVPEVLHFDPVGLEGIDDVLVSDMIAKHLHPERLRILPQGKGFLLCEFGGETKEEADDRARECMEHFSRKLPKGNLKLYDDRKEEQIVWKVRESGLGATARIPGKPDAWEGWEDSAVHPDQIGGYLREFRKLLDRYDYTGALYGHFGQGCLHTRIDFDLVNADGIRKFKSFIREAAELVVSFGGSISGEHGDGQSKAEFLPIMYGDDLVRAFQEFKALWDPQWKMNPGKVVHPYDVDENLRLGKNYNPPLARTHFKFAEDDGTFARATTRCVGVGECRRITQAGTMCPSFKVTREEAHSTRGRAHLLFEMLEGKPLKGGWKNEGVREALDLCLSCKGCLSDCPMNVDMASYKAEFLSHYYQGRLRPVAAYAMGLVYWWAQLGSIFPRLTNFLTHAPFLKSIAKRLGGIAPERDVPRFAKQTFRDWYGARHAHRTISLAERRVILWADTFNNHFFPDTAKAALEVLEAAGFSVTIPHQQLCCGRPLYDYGFLKQARRMLLRTMSALRTEIEAGTPIVFLEPSCLAVFRHELRQFFPQEPNAERLARQSMLLSEFLEKYAPDLELPRLRAKALVQGHCHQKAVAGMDSEQSVLERMGVQCEILDLGCCGMAGSFGFEKDHYDVSVRVGEYALLPKIRSAEPGTIVLANGFSCREQIRQLAGVKTLHLAELLQQALRTRKSISDRRLYEERRSASGAGSGS